MNMVIPAAELEGGGPEPYPSADGRTDLYWIAEGQTPGNCLEACLQVPGALNG